MEAATSPTPVDTSAPYPVHPSHHSTHQHSQHSHHPAHYPPRHAPPHAPLHAPLSPHPSAQGPEPERPRPVGIDPVLRNTKVLVVEDEPDVRRLMVAVLSVYGAVVLTAANVEEGLALYTHSRPDVILSDIGMPERDGYEFISLVRQMEQSSSLGHTPAAAITAYAQPQDRTRALEAGFDQHVVKPIKAHQLVSLITTMVKK